MARTPSSSSNIKTTRVGKTQEQNPATSTEPGNKHHHQPEEEEQEEDEEDYKMGGGGRGGEGFWSENRYQQAIIEIYESLYQFQRHRSRPQETQVVDCLSKWYELNAVFENPFTRASGVLAIVNQFSLMSLLPGSIWSELGDICQSEDYGASFSLLETISFLTKKKTTTTTVRSTIDSFLLFIFVYIDGNRVVVFSHTLHFDLLGSSEDEASGGGYGGGIQTPYLSVPATPHVGTPNTQGKFPSSLHATMMGRLSKGSQPGANMSLLERLRVIQSGGDTETMWPLQWLLSSVSPRTIAARLARFDLKLSTRLQFNEQARIVSHQDIWGIKELVDCLAPSLFVHLYSCQRWLVGLSADFLSRRYLRSSVSNSSASTDLDPSPSLLHNDRPNPSPSALHSPIFIRSNGSPINHINSHHHRSSAPTLLHPPPPPRPQSSTSTASPVRTPINDNHQEEEEEEDELTTEVGSLDGTRSSDLYHHSFNI
jgi:hypothetical protein